MWNVDVSAAALELGREHHQLGGARFEWIAADVFEWLRLRSVEPLFDLIIADPPNMAAEMGQVPAALRTYQRLYGAARKVLCDDGVVVGSCSSSRIRPQQVRKALGAGLGRGPRHLQRLPSEVDHPVGFAEADYLKIFVSEPVAT